jgi:hypothetical protein
MKLLIIIFFILMGVIVVAQNDPDTVYQVEITATASALISLFDEGRYPNAPNDVSLGYGFFLRGMWHPARLLSVGLMTGFTQIAEDEFSVDTTINNELGNTAKARLSAIPIQVVVSMQGKDFEIGLGMGPYMMLSTINYGKTAQGRRYELGLTFFGSYFFSLNNNIRIGPELRVLYLSYRGIVSVMPSLSIRLETLRY